MKPNLTNASIVLRGTSTRNRVIGSGKALAGDPMSGSGDRPSPHLRNAGVAAEASLSAPTVNTPEAIAWATHRRPAVSKALRQAGRQNTCRRPPAVRV